MKSPEHIETRWTGLSEVVRMSGPIILGSLSFTIMQFVDQVMVSQLGPEALAAVGTAGLWSFTLSTFFLGIVSCVATFVSQSLGRGNLEQCAQYAWQGIYISILVGALAIVLWPWTDALFWAMRHAPETARLEIIYFRIRLIGYLFIAWQASLTAFFQSVNLSKIPMYAGIAANVVNLVLAYALIFGRLGAPRWGVAGAATATVFSLFIQAFLLQVIFLSRRMNLRFGTRGSYRIDRTKIIELCRIGWPVGVQFFMDIFNWAIFTSFVVGAFGTAQLAAHNAAISFMSLSFMPALGLHHGIAPIVGQWIGRGNTAIAKARTYTAMRLAMGYMFLMGLLMGFYGRTLMQRVFSNDPEVIDLGGLLLICAAIFQTFDAINIVVSGALRGAGDTRWMAVVTVLAAYVVFLPLAYYFAYPRGLGAFGAWIGATIYIITIPQYPTRPG
ncbi:MAG: MATE family efflux transporter [Candidatus Hydrogenedentes bacterium]|nr:MATE family efflux transporter [Candidatus Hydrogenedentota bacterium]